MPSLPCWVLVKRRGLSAGHSCFPFQLNHTAAIWTRLSQCAALLSSSAGPEWASPDRPGPQSACPCLLLRWLILPVPALCRSEDHPDSSGLGRTAHVDMLLYECVCVKYVPCNISVSYCPFGDLLSNVAKLNFNWVSIRLFSPAKQVYSVVVFVYSSLPLNFLTVCFFCVCFFAQMPVIHCLLAFSLTARAGSMNDM